MLPLLNFCIKVFARINTITICAIGPNKLAQSYQGHTSTTQRKFSTKAFHWSQHWIKQCDWLYFHLRLYQPQKNSLELYYRVEFLGGENKSVVFNNRKLCVRMLTENFVFYMWKVVIIKVIFYCLSHALAK